MISQIDDVNENDDTIDDDLFKFESHCHSICCTIHTSRVPDSWGGCIQSWIGLANGVILLIVFGYVLRKIFRSNRRSRAGYTKNTVSLDTHVRLFNWVLVWTVGWGLFQVFSFKDGTLNLPPPFLVEGELYYATVATMVVYGTTESFGLLILLLLVSDSIGRDNMHRASLLSSAYGALVAVVIGAVMILSPGAYNPSEPAIPAHLNWVMIAVRCSDVCLVTLAVRLTAQRAPDRTAVRTYAKFVVLSSCAFILGRALSFQAPLRLLNGAGLCVLDVAVMFYFSAFAPTVYVTLKTDSQYWMHDTLDTASTTVARGMSLAIDNNGRKSGGGGGGESIRRRNQRSSGGVDGGQDGGGSSGCGDNVGGLASGGFGWLRRAKERDDDEEESKKERQEGGRQRGSLLGLDGDGADVDDHELDEEQRALADFNDETLTEQLPVFEEVVIPKTELYLRKKLEERMDSSIEVHLWRRNLVVVKRFKLDFLTRENIKLFKKEANVNRKLAHENVVKFFGVVIDPPCMSIVMEYGVRGDLFSFLRTLNEKVLEERQSHSSSLIGGGGRNNSNADSDRAWALAASTSSSTPPGQHRRRQRGGSSSGRGYGGRHGLLVSQFDPIKCALDIACGVRYLHAHGMVHCDLKTKNVVLDASLTAKITDFGDVQEAASGGGGGDPGRQHHQQTGNNQQQLRQQGSRSMLPSRSSLFEACFGDFDTAGLGDFRQDSSSWGFSPSSSSSSAFQKGLVATHNSSQTQPLAASAYAGADGSGSVTTGGGDGDSAYLVSRLSVSSHNSSVRDGGGVGTGLGCGGVGDHVDIENGGGKDYAAAAAAAAHADGGEFDKERRSSRFSNDKNNPHRSTRDYDVGLDVGSGSIGGGSFGYSSVDDFGASCGGGCAAGGSFGGCGGGGCVRHNSGRGEGGGAGRRGSSHLQPPAPPLVANLRSGTVPWAAPELVTGENDPSFQSDAFAFAIILWELATWKAPFFLVARLEEEYRLQRYMSRSSSFATSSLTGGGGQQLLQQRDSSAATVVGSHSSSSSSSSSAATAAFAAATVAGAIPFSNNHSSFSDLHRARSSSNTSCNNGNTNGNSGGVDYSGSQSGASQLQAVGLDRFNPKKRVGRTERDRRANMRPDTAVLAVAGEVITASSSTSSSWHRHHRAGADAGGVGSSKESSKGGSASGGGGCGASSGCGGGAVSSLSSSWHAAFHAEHETKVLRNHFLLSESSSSASPLSPQHEKGLVAVPSGDTGKERVEGKWTVNGCGSGGGGGAFEAEVNPLHEPFLVSQPAASVIQPAAAADAAAAMPPPPSHFSMNSLDDLALLDSSSSSSHGPVQGVGSGGLVGDAGGDSLLGGSWHGGCGACSGGGSTAAVTTTGVDAVEVQTPEEALDVMVIARYRPPLPVRAPADYVGLMRQCWRHDWEARPDFTAIVSKLEEIHYSQKQLPASTFGSGGGALAGGGDGSRANSKDVRSRVAFPCGIANFACKDETDLQPLWRS